MDRANPSEARKSMAGKTSRFLILAIAGSSLLSGHRIFAQTNEPADAEEMKREIRALKLQIQSLRAALAEAAEFDRLRANALARALGTGGAATTSESPAPPKASDAGRRAPAAPKPSAPALTPRHTAQAEGPGGTVRGKVDVSGGEPVAYVYVENIRGPAVRDKKVIQQVNKQFVPSWAVVQRGTTVEFPNADHIYHNVFSLSSGNTFDLGLYNSASEAKSHTFDEPGAVDVYCNIHPQMAASVLVVPNRFFAKVKPDGTFEIPNVPSGRRKIVAWAPGARLASDWVEVQGGGSASINLKLDAKAGTHTNKQGRSYGSYE